MNRYNQLISIFEEAIQLLTRSGNQYEWTYWKNTADAVSDIRSIVDSLKRGEFNEVEIGLSFVPACALQEVAMSNHWSREYLALSARFDTAFAAAKSELEDGL